MKLFVPILLALTTATVLAFVKADPTPEAPPIDPGKVETAGMMPSGPLLPPLEVYHDPVTVPEPVWASILAACAVSLLRRGRQ